MNIKSTLQGYNFQVLQVMARMNGISVDSHRKVPHVKALAKALYTKKAVERVLPQLSPRERRALDMLILHGGSMTSQRLKQVLKREDLIEEHPESKNRYSYYRRVEGNPHRKDSRYFQDIIMRLTCLGLIVSQGNSDTRTTVIGFIPGIRLIIPPQITGYMPQVTFEEDTTVPDIDIKVESSARIFQRDLYLYWSYIRDHKTYLTNKGYVYKRALKKLNDTLLVQGDMSKGMGEKESPRLYFSRLLLQQLGLLKARRQSTLSAIPDIGFWSDSPLGRVRKSYKAWLNEPFWNELEHLLGIGMCQ